MLIEPYSANALTAVAATRITSSVVPLVEGKANCKPAKGMATVGVFEARRTVSKIRPIRNGVAASSKPTIATRNSDIRTSQACGLTYAHSRDVMCDRPWREPFLLPHSVFAFSVSAQPIPATVQMKQSGSFF